MNRIPSRGLAVALLAGGLSVLGVGTSAAHSPADKGDNPIADLACKLRGGGHSQYDGGGGGQGDCAKKPGAQSTAEGDDPISRIACQLQMKQGQCQGHPGGGGGGGQQPPGDHPKAGDDPISKLMCGLQGGKGGGDCQSKPGGGGSGGGGSGGGSYPHQ